MNHGELIEQVGALVKQGHPYGECVQGWQDELGWRDTKYPSWYLDSEYRVAITFIEGKPLFEGMEFYTTSGCKCTAGEEHRGYDFTGCTLTKPEPKPTTFTLNGEVLPLPDYVGWGQANHFVVVVDNRWWCYKSREDADKVHAAFAKLTEGL